MASKKGNGNPWGERHTDNPWEGLYNSDSLQVFVQAQNRKYQIQVANARQLAQIEDALRKKGLRDERQLREESYRIAAKYEENLNASRNLYQKQQAIEQRKNALQNYRDQLSQEMLLAKTRGENDAQIAKYRKRQLIVERQLNEEAAAAQRLQQQLLFQKKHEELQKDIAAEREALAGRIPLSVTHVGSSADARAYTQQQRVIEADQREKAFLHAMNTIADDLKKSFKSSIDDAMSITTQYQAKIDARLQGTEKTFKDSSDLISKNLAVSPYVKQKDMIQNLSKLVEQGIAYNLEERAFLASVQDNIASTFDVFDASLIQLIKLQQADTSAARLGMEASLTKLFNSTFNDSSYLSDSFDGVSAALMNATAQLDKNAGVEFEYAAQKWLGALGSLGASSSTLTTIASGLGYLGTGDVGALAGNSSLQSLLALSASRAGLSYADMLTNGLTASSTNMLLKSMVEYLADIANNTDNKVVSKAYTDIFGMSSSDLLAFKTLSQGSTIDELFATNLSYREAMGELQSQFGQLSSRLTVAQKMANIFENVTYSFGQNIANSPAMYSIWKLSDYSRQITGGGIQLPSISVMGNSVSLGKLEDVLQLIPIGYGAISMIGDIVSSIGGGFGTDLGVWGFDEFNTRGSGFTTSDVAGLSYSTKYVASGSAADTKEGAISDAAGEAKNISGSAGVDEAKYSFDDLYESLFREGSEAQLSSLYDTLTNTPISVKDETLQQDLSGLAQKLSLALQQSVVNVNVKSVGEGASVGDAIPILLHSVGDAYQQYNNQTLQSSADLVSALTAERVYSGKTAENGTVSIAELLEFLVKKAAHQDSVNVNVQSVNTDEVNARTLLQASANMRV